MKTKWILVSSVFIIAGFLFLISFFRDSTLVTEDKRTALGTQSQAREQIAKALTPHILFGETPKTLNIADKSLDVEYTLDSDLQNESAKLLQQYKPDYGAIVMLNAKTGQVLAMSSFVKGNPKAENLNLRATFPAASIFKIITASTAIDRNGIDPDHQIAFNGGNYTLYKKNVLSEKVNKWTRFISLKDAFARSINTAFARLTLEKLQPKDIAEYTKRFMFNKYIPADFEIAQSQAVIPDEKGFELTEVSSGFNRFNTMSPVHGAMIAAAIVNDGQIIAPYMVNQLKLGEVIQYAAEPFVIGQAVTVESAKKMRSMMEQTILAGTSRKTFRKIVKDKKFKEVEMGGKTGHFTGLQPKGRNDWFVGYATDGDNKVAIAAITVNVEKWTVKSSALAEMMFSKHFKNIINERAVSKKLNQQQQGNDPSLLVGAKSDKLLGF